MKAERIELPGGYWIDTETVEQNIIAPDEEWVGSFNVGSDEQILAFAAAMNADAARVQLLAKALRAYEQHHDSTFISHVDGGKSERASLRGCRRMAKAALTEAGLNEQKEG